MEGPEARRIVLLGKTGAGKSSLANTILGEKLFLSNSSFNSGTKKCQTETKSLNGWEVTLIDTPGFFTTDMAEKDLKSEILRCIIECAPGPRAFLIVLKVGKFTEQEQDVVNKIFHAILEVYLSQSESNSKLFQANRVRQQEETILQSSQSDNLRHLQKLTNSCGNMTESTLRIAVLGKTGTGKSSLGNTIFGEKMFKIHHNADSGTSECKLVTRDVDGRSITFIDTPGFFDSRTSEDEQKSEIANCITECSPGLDAFLILLKVERYTKQEEEVIEKIKQSFSEEAFKYAVLVFTHGDQLEEDIDIKDFVKTNKSLHDLSNKCGGRCHVIDNKYWNNNQQRKSRNNQIQIKKLLSTITEMVEKNGGCYTNEMLQAVERRIKEEEEGIRSESGDLSDEEIREKAKRKVAYGIRAAGITTGILLGALLAVPFLVLKVVEVIATLCTSGKTTGSAEGVVKGAGIISGAPSVVRAAGIAIGAVCLVGGAAYGGYVGYCEADEADSASEAAKNTATVLFEEAIAPGRNVVDIIRQKRKQQQYDLLKNE